MLRASATDHGPPLTRLATLIFARHGRRNGACSVVRMVQTTVSRHSRFGSFSSKSLGGRGRSLTHQDRRINEQHGPQVHLVAMQSMHTLPAHNGFINVVQLTSAQPSNLALVVRTSNLLEGVVTSA